MYILHLIICFSFILGIILCIPVEINGELLKSELYLLPFMKLAAGLRHVYKRLPAAVRGVRNNELSNSLLMLNPAGDGRLLLETYETKRLGNTLLLIFAGNLLAFFVCLSGMTDKTLIEGSYIERNMYGEGEKNVTLDIYADGELIAGSKDLTIRERQYTEEEINQQFENIGVILEKEILGENESLDEVRHRLILVDHVEGFPVSISWELSNYSVLSGDGRINADKAAEEGTYVELTAIMTYFGFQGEHHFGAMIFPPLKADDEALADNIFNAIESYETKSSSYEVSALPKEVDGHKITYESPKKNDSGMLLILIGIMASFVYYSASQDLNKKLKQRDLQLMMDYPQIVSKLTLLIGAGMTIKAAFTKLALDYESRRRNSENRFAYEEMLFTVRQLEGGLSEGDAYVTFGERCHLQKYIKLGALLSQNLKKGSSGLLQALEEEERDAFEERKSLARRLGEEAGTKLLAPMGIMLMIVMVIVIFPAFMSFGQ